MGLYYSEKSDIFKVGDKYLLSYVVSSGAHRNQLCPCWLSMDKKDVQMPIVLPKDIDSAVQNINVAFGAPSNIALLLYGPTQRTNGKAFYNYENFSISNILVMAANQLSLNINLGSPSPWESAGWDDNINSIPGGSIVLCRFANSTVTFTFS